MDVIEIPEKQSNKAFILYLYEKYAPWIRMRISKYVSDPFYTEDLLQDCIINLSKHADKLRTFNHKQLRAYIAVTADHAAINFSKKSSREFPISFLDDIYDDVEADIEGFIENKLVYEDVLAIIKTLSKRDQDIITMKYYLELENKQIADILQIKEDCVKTTIYRSIKKLTKKMMEACEYE